VGAACSVPPKNASKVEEKTFGMKNKSKSKKIQQYVESIKKEEQRKGPSPAVRSRLAIVCRMCGLLLHGADTNGFHARVCFRRS
jgi:hypothetical protein